MSLLFEKKESSGIQASVWKIKGREFFPEELLSPDCQNRINTSKSEVYRSQFYAIRRLLLTQKIDLSTLYYHPSGKLMSKQVALSTTHTKKLVATLTSSQKSQALGIDLQQITPRLEGVTDKFCDREKGYLKKTQDLEKKTMIWAAKEAVYKSIRGRNIVDYKRDLEVLPFEDGCRELYVYKKGHTRAFSVRVLKLEDYILTYTVPS